MSVVELRREDATMSAAAPNIALSCVRTGLSTLIGNCAVAGCTR